MAWRQLCGSASDSRLWNIPAATAPASRTKAKGCLAGGGGSHAVQDAASIIAEQGSTAALRSGSRSRRRKRLVENQLQKVLSLCNRDRLRAVSLAVDRVSLRGVIQAQGSKNRSKCLTALQRCVESGHDVLNLSGSTVSERDAAVISLILSTLHRSKMRDVAEAKGLRSSMLRRMYPANTTTTSSTSSPGNLESTRGSKGCMGEMSALASSWANSSMKSVMASPVRCIAVCDCVFACSLMFLVDAVRLHGVECVVFSQGPLATKPHAGDPTPNALTAEQHSERRLLEQHIGNTTTTTTLPTPLRNVPPDPLRGSRAADAEGLGGGSVGGSPEPALLHPGLSLDALLQGNCGSTFHRRRESPGVAELCDFVAWMRVERQVLEIEREGELSELHQVRRVALRDVVTSPAYRASVLGAMAEVEKGEVRGRRSMQKSEFRNYSRVCERVLSSVQGYGRDAIVQKEGSERLQVVGLEDDNFHLALHEQRERQRKQRAHRLFIMHGEEAGRLGVAARERADYATISALHSMSRGRADGTQSPPRTPCASPR